MTSDTLGEQEVLAAESWPVEPGKFSGLSLRAFLPSFSRYSIDRMESEKHSSVVQSNFATCPLIVNLRARRENPFLPLHMAKMLC